MELLEIGQYGDMKPWQIGLLVVFLVGCVTSPPEVEAAPESRVAYEEAMELLSKGRQKDAEARVVEACRTYPDCQRLLFLRGVLERSRFNTFAAGQSFSEVYALGEETAPGRAAAAVTTMDMDLMVEAGFESLRGLISEHPDEILIRWLFAIECREHRTHSLEAAQQYEVILEEWEIAPVLVHQTYANILTEALDRPEDALKHRWLAAELEPKSWTYQGLANTLKAMERYEEADGVYAKLLELAPVDSDFWRQWGTCLFHMGDYADAIEKFKKAYQYEPSEVSSLLFWGRSLQLQGRLEDGFSKYAESFVQEPEHRYASVYATLSKLYGYGTEPNYGKALEYAEVLKIGKFPVSGEALRDCIGANEGGRHAPLMAEKNEVMFAHLRELAGQGNPNAQFNLGKILRWGVGTEADALAATGWFEKSLNGGLTESAVELARLYNYGGGGLKADAVKSFEYYRIAAEGGNTGAMREVGRRYLMGKGVEPNLEKAVEWLDRCGEQGGSLSQPYRLLGAIFRVGKNGASKDWNEAARWYQKGSDLGDATCERLIGNMYEEGGEDFPRNIDKAMEYYQRVWERSPRFHNGARALIDLYCKCDDSSYRDPKKAIELGLDIVEKNPKNTVCLKALAMAYAYDGQFDKAIKYQEQANRMGTPAHFKKPPPDKTLELYRQGRVE